MCSEILRPGIPFWTIFCASLSAWNLRWWLEAWIVRWNLGVGLRLGGSGCPWNSVRTIESVSGWNMGFEIDAGTIVQIVIQWLFTVVLVRRCCLYIASQPMCVKFFYYVNKIFGLVTSYVILQHVTNCLFCYQLEMSLKSGSLIATNKLASLSGRFFCIVAPSE